MTKAEHFEAALSREGLVPETDADGDLRFKFEGGHYVLYPDTEDEPYVRILFPNFWTIESEDELHRAYRASSVASRRCKGAKVWLRDDEQDVCASIEAFLPGPEFLEYVLGRMLSALQYAARQFRDEMQAPPSDTADETGEGEEPADLDALVDRFLREHDTGAHEPGAEPDSSAAPDDSPGDRIAGQLGDLPSGDAPDAPPPGPAPGGPAPDAPSPDRPGTPPTHL